MTDGVEKPEGMMHYRLVVTLVTIFLIAAPLPAQQPQQPPPDPSVTAFVDVSVIPMDRERVLPHQTVLVRGNHVVALGPARRVRVPAEARRIDGRGKFLIPGLADMHVHLWLQLDTLGTKDTTGSGALAADKLFAYLAAGVTTVRDMHSGDPASPTLWVREQVARGALLGPRVYTAGDPTGIVGSPDLESLAASVTALKAAGHDFLKLYAWPRPAYDTGLAAAARVGLRVVGHVPDTVAEDFPTALRDWTSVEHLTGYAPYLGFPAWPPPVYDSTAPWAQPGYQLDGDRLRKVVEATRRARVWNCPTLAIFARASAMTTKNDAKRGAYEALFLHLRRQIVKALQDAGAGLLLGSDIDNASAHEELQQLVQAGLTPYQALATGTRNAAEFLGTLDSTGTVAVGKRADLVLLVANPLEDIRHTTALAGVMVGGRWLAPATVVARLESWSAASDSVAVKSVSPVQQAANEFRAYLRKGLRPLWP